MAYASIEQFRSAPLSRLNRSVIFLTERKAGTGEVLLLDRFEFPLSEADAKRHIFNKIESSLDISFIGDVVGMHELEILLADQFSAASEYVYGHHFWESIRCGSRSALYAYLLETRHYLAAAASRMAPSIGHGIGLPPLVLLLSNHLLEEWDHAKFFSEALEQIGCNSVLTSTARPIPATLEWIHATRAIGHKSGLSAAVCSGFMEYSSKETQAVRSWHSMLVDSGLLPATANQAIIGHFETDLDFDHADNWKRAIRLHGPVTPSVAAELLNDVATIAEMIYRWLSALQRGCASSLVYGMQIMTEECLLTDAPANHHPYEVACFNGLPVWPSTLMDLVNWGDGAPTEPSILIGALTYAFGHRDAEIASADQPMASALHRFAHQFATIEDADLSSASSLEAIATSWLRSIDGHSLWDRMIEPSSDALVIGYILENYHYLASATRHISAAISSCTNTSIRLQLIEHLQDELEHCHILGEKLKTVADLPPPHTMRPLPTTVAFVGYLETLAEQDWKAYILVSAFLQASLTECRKTDRHSQFYQSVIKANPSAEPLLRTIWSHDDIDKDLGHDAKPIQRLASLVSSEPLSRDSMGHAALGPALAWSFFDGIARHYANGRGAVLQRAGWRAC